MDIVDKIRELLNSYWAEYGFRPKVITIAPEIYTAMSWDDEIIYYLKYARVNIYYTPEILANILDVSCVEISSFPPPKFIVRPEDIGTDAESLIEKARQAVLAELRELEEGL